LSAYRRALRLEPRCLVAWVNRGRSQAALARLAVALESYDRALELDRQCVAAWMHRAVALARLGRGGEALVSSNRAIRLAPRSAEAWQAKAQVLTEALGRQQEAEGCRRRASALGYRLAPGQRFSDEPFPGAPFCCIEPYLRPCNCAGAAVDSTPL
jgi:tetratricopeptide (TPR) repeat protein